MDKQLVTLVNSSDQIQGYMDKHQAHEGEAQLHRAASVFLFDDQDRLLVQQRSQFKIVAPNQWANTVCGNVLKGESYEDCAYRRLRQELGITTADIKPVYKFQYQVECNDKYGENEIDQVFLGRCSELPTPNPQEVRKTDWLSFSKLKDFDSTVLKSKTLSPWFELMLNDHKLISKINNFLN